MEARRKGGIHHAWSSLVMPLNVPLDLPLDVSLDVIFEVLFDLLFDVIFDVLFDVRFYVSFHLSCDVCLFYPYIRLMRPCLKALQSELQRLKCPWMCRN